MPSEADTCRTLILPKLCGARWTNESAFNVHAVVTANLQCATRLRQSILQKAFIGGLV